MGSSWITNRKLTKFWLLSIRYILVTGYRYNGNIHFMMFGILKYPYFGRINIIMYSLFKKYLFPSQCNTILNQNSLSWIKIFVFRWGLKRVINPLYIRNTTLPEVGEQKLRQTLKSILEVTMPIFYMEIR